MFWLKGCPRCGGDLQEEIDYYGTEVVCLQCGYSGGPPGVTPFPVRRAALANAQSKAPVRQHLPLRRAS